MKKNNFDPKDHQWEVFVLSFHKDSFCYSGHCMCHDLDFDGKDMPYELLDGSYGMLMSRVNDEYVAMPLDRVAPVKHIAKLQEKNKVE